MSETTLAMQKHLYIPFSVLLLIIAGCIGYLFITTKANEIAIERVNTYVAQNYAPNVEVSEAVDGVSSDIIRMEQRLQSRLTRIEEKIGK